MPIPENQLQTWSHQGAITSSAQTVASIEHALNSYSWPDGIRREVYLQGSYKNSTNIRGDSDVDVIVQLNSCFYSHLSEEQKRCRGMTRGRYTFNDFRPLALEALVYYYGMSLVVEGNKSIKVRGTKLPADVIPSVQYRKYYNPEQNNSYAEGLAFWTQNAVHRVVNYPKIHYNNGVCKHQSCGNRYKSVVRMFKNIRTYLVDNHIIGESLAPSYFLECLLYNVPNENFSHNLQSTFCDIVNWLNNAELGIFLCQNGQTPLFSRTILGQTSEQWSIHEAREFINSAIYLWGNFG
jgi:hypothetical protein